MSNLSSQLNEQEQKALIGTCILAAFADGKEDELERAQIRKAIEGFSDDLINEYQQVLGGKVTLRDFTWQLRSPESKALAFEMADCVCHADGVVNEAEKQFLATLRHELQLDSAFASSHEQSAAALAAEPFQGAAPPVIASVQQPEIDRLILNTAILNGALEILPNTLATMAIIPVQMRMVYQIGKHHGYELDRGHVRDFLATVGVGLSSQVVENFASRFVGRLARKFAGRIIGGLASQAISSAFSFATTYALGQVAKRYYAAGRTLTGSQLKEVFSSMFQEGKGMQGNYAGEIAARARQINVSQLVPLVRGM